MTVLLVSGGAAIVIAFFLLWSWKQRSGPRAQLEKAERLLRDGKTKEAQARLLHVVALVEKGKVKDPERAELASRAHFAIAEIEDGEGKRKEAGYHYHEAKALGASLPTGAILLLAEYYADDNLGSEDAVTAYLTYLSSGPKSGSAAMKVYSAVQNLCQVTEDMKSAQRRPLAELNRRVIVANPNLEWAHYFLGLANLLDGRASDAIEAFVEAHKLNPDRALTNYWLGVCHLQLSNPDLEAAISAIERFLSFPHSDAKNRKREARLCSEVSRRLIEKLGGFAVSKKVLKEDDLQGLDKAIHYLEVASERQAEDASIQHDLGRAYRLKGEHATAVTAFRQAIQLNPSEKQYAYDLGLECLESGQLSEAIVALERAVQIHPSFEDAHGVLGAIYFERNEFEKAIAHLQAALDSGKRNPNRLGLLVRSLFARGNYERVAEELDRRKADPTPFQDDLDAAYAAGCSFSALSRFDQAITWLKRLPEMPEAIYLLGCAYANVNEFVAARVCFDQLVETGDKWAWKAMLQRGHLLLLQGDDRGAEEDYRKIVDKEPANGEAIRALGDLALMRGDIGEAVVQFSAGVVTEPENGEFHFALGVALERKGDLVEALSNYEFAHRSGIGDVALLRIGVVRCRQGEFAEALKVFDQCDEHAIQSDTLLFYRGLASVLLGNCPDAIRDWTQLQQRYSENERLQLNLARARYVLGTQCLERGEYEPTVQQWEQYLSHFPMDESVVKDVGELYFRKALALIRTESTEVPTGARGCIEEALRRDPQNNMFRFYLALCEERSRSNTGGGMTLLENLAEQQWCAVRVQYHLGLCILNRGDSDRAARVFREVQGMPEAGNYRRYASWALANLLIGVSEFQEASEILMSSAEPGGRDGLEVQQ